MDLRSVLNTSDNGDRAPGKEPPTPQQQQQQRHSSHPLQSPVQYGYREYGQHSAHPSPGKPPPEYQRSSQHQHPSAYPPPSPYQGAAGPYPLRSQQPHAVPPNPSSFIDARQPAGIAPQTQTQYRPGPTHASPPAAASGYPFTQAHSGQDMTSPSQRHQYPPNHYSHQPHSNDGYPQNALAQGSGGYAQQHTVPQTPPIGTNNGPSAQYIHQRSQSTHSTPTPTSAHSQQQFGPPHLHGSPVPTSRSISEYRQPSQPPTPLGPPQSATSFRHTGPPGPANQAQPSSPYQQRIASHGSGLPPSSSPHAGTPLRRASGPNAADALSETHSRSNSKHDRENSPSVSPKTRVASIAGSSDKAMTSPVDVDRQSMVTQGPDMEVDRGIIPAKRKLNDRSLSPSELEHKEARPAPAEVNGSHPARLTGSSSFSASKRSRTLHAQPPVWAQSGSTLGNKMPKHANFVLQKRIHSHINGKVAGASKSDHQSRQASPDPAKTSFSGPSGKVAAPAAASATDPGPQDTLGPWEASLIGVKPYEEISKTVADFIFINVLNNPDFKEIMNRGIQFEIEAKLGTLIDKDTNHRVDRMLDSECILHDNGRVAFRSSMTEAHHKAFNDFLNQAVIQTDPRALNGGGRVQVHYKHRREVDKYFELSADLQSRLPGCMLARFDRRSKTVKARVTYDQKSGDVLNKIVKARVADIDLHMPMNPMDCRVSINLEMDWDGPVQELEQLSPNEKMPSRQKDRLSYTQGHYQIDLTQVTLSGSMLSNSQRTDKEHELEIELAAPIVLDQGTKAISGASHRYPELIEGFIDNVRVLARKAKEFS